MYRGSSLRYAIGHPGAEPLASGMRQADIWEVPYGVDYDMILAIACIFRLYTFLPSNIMRGPSLHPQLYLAVSILHGTDPPYPLYSKPCAAVFFF